MPPHPQAQAVIGKSTWTDLDPGKVGIDELRRIMNAHLIELAGSGPVLPKVFDVTIAAPSAPIPVRVYRPVLGRERLPVFIYFHSGGYSVYDIDTADAQCRTIAKTANCIVVSVGYRLAPEAPFPAAVDDAWAAVQWVATDPDVLCADVRRLAVRVAAARWLRCARCSRGMRVDPNCRASFYRVPFLK